MNNDIKRISQLTAIIAQLQTKRLLTAAQLAKRFQVSVRTIYRDIKVLEQAGVPILMEEVKGYLLMVGYSVPPMMFTEGEANAQITTEQLILKSSDSSFRNEYKNAIEKIRAVLPYSTKEKAALFIGQQNCDQSDNFRASAKLFSNAHSTCTDFFSGFINHL